MDIDFGKPVGIAYHTSHLVSDTGTMTLAEGADKGYRQSMVGILHQFDDRFEIEPLVIGAPWYDHPRNGEGRENLMWLGRDLGEILPEDIEEFSRMTEVEVENADDTVSSVDQDDGQIAGRGAGGHVAGVLFMAGRVGDDEFAFSCGKVPIGNVDRDTLFALGFEAVREQRRVEVAPGGAVH